MHIKNGQEELKKSIGNLIPRLYDEKLTSSLINSAKYLLDQKNPVFRSISWEGFVAIDNDRIDGVVVASIDPRLQINNHPIGILGFFESDQNEEISRQLLEAACQWLKEQGINYVVGPMNFNTWNQYRFITEQGEDPSFLFEPQHKSYYPKLWEAAGFTSKFTYYSGARSDFATLLPYTKPAYEAALKKGFNIRTFDTSRFEEEMRAIHAITIKIFENNLGFIPLSFEEYRYIYEPISKLFDPSLTHFIEKDGQVIGYSYSMADRLFPEQKRVILKTMGLLPEWQGQHLGAALAHAQHTEMQHQGFEEIIYALIADGNAISKMEYPGARIIRRYTLYEKKL